MPKFRSFSDWQLKKLMNPKVAASYLNAALSDSPEMFLKALRKLAQAHQMTRVAKEAGVQRETLYRSLSEQGNPTLDTLYSVLGVIGLKILISANAEPTLVGAPTAGETGRSSKAASEVSSEQISHGSGIQNCGMELDQDEDDDLIKSAMIADWRNSSNSGTGVNSWNQLQ